LLIGVSIEAVAIDVSDDILGERIKLFVTLIPGERMGRGKNIKFCKSRLPVYKVLSETMILRVKPKIVMERLIRRA
jgi:acyl-CoA synthetase (AMP-forming)/AMP-acid ligase II